MKIFRSSAKEVFERRIFIYFFIIFILSSCETLKPYQRIYVNDPQMKFDDDSGTNFINYVDKIRTGSIPGSSTSSSGGCGCN